MVEEHISKKYLLGALVVTVILFAAVYFFLKYQSTQKLLSNPSAVSELEVSSLISKVGKLIDLPQNEIPKIATVSDKTKLQNQSFFTKAQNGDKVLIYEDNKKAILYRPSTGKIIEISKISIPKQQSTLPPVTVSPTKSVIVNAAIYNGTTVVGSAAATEKELILSFPQIKVVTKGNATGDYKKTLVIDISGKNSDLVNKLAASLSGDKSTFPQTEIKPQADILIILGK